MKTLLYFGLFFLSQTAMAQDEQTCMVTADFFHVQLTSAQYEKAVTHFSDPLKSKIDAGQLERIWDQLETQFGDYTGAGVTTLTEIDGTISTVQPLHFEKSSLDLKLGFDTENRIAGLFFAPSQTTTLDLTETEQFREVSFPLHTSKKIILPGILTLPKKNGPHPILILVHGSGPQDMDVTIGPNKLFRDLAHGLAEKGIAVYRYEKRTRYYAGKPELDVQSLTLYEETIEDATKAVKRLGKDKRIDKKNIFVLGHSLGGMAAPLIASKSGKVKGIILMGGNARPLEELVLEQLNYLAQEDDRISEEEQANIGQYNRQLEELEKMKQGNTFIKEALPLGLPEAYWEYLIHYDQVETITKLNQQVLILQGERDYQVTMTDFEQWKAAVGAKDNVTMISYPKLNHIFKPGLGEGNSYPSEYEMKQPLPAKVIADIAQWILD